MSGLPKQALKKKKTSTSGSDAQISDSIKNEVDMEINLIVDKLHTETALLSSDFPVIKNDRIIPLFVVIISFLTLIGGGLFFLTFYNSKEQSLLTSRKTVLSAESKILEAVKAKSRKQISMRDQQIQSIQTQLSTAIRDKDNLKADTERTLVKREEELRKAMESALEAERAKLIEQGLSSEDVQKQISEKSQQLEADNKAQLESLRKQYELELAQKESAMTKQIDEYQKSLQQTQSEQDKLQALMKQKEEEMLLGFNKKSTALENEKNSISARLEDLETVNRNEQLIFSQILASYIKIEKQIQSSKYASANAEIDKLENYIKQKSIPELPGVMAKVPEENFVIKTLREYIKMKRTLEEFRRERAGLYSSISSLKATVSNQDNQLNAQKVTITQLETEKKKRETLLHLVTDLQTRYRSYSSKTPKSDKEGEDQILDLLGTKVLLKEIVSTDPVKSRYPAMADQLDSYFNTYGETLKKEGRKAEISDVNTVLVSLIQHTTPGDTTIADQKKNNEGFVLFLDNLSKLLK